MLGHAIAADDPCCDAVVIDQERDDRLLGGEAG